MCEQCVTSVSTILRLWARLKYHFAIPLNFVLSLSEFKISLCYLFEFCLIFWNILLLSLWVLCYSSDFWNIPILSLTVLCYPRSPWNILCSFFEGVSLWLWYCDYFIIMILWLFDYYDFVTISLIWFCDYFIIMILWLFHGYIAMTYTNDYDFVTTISWLYCGDIFHCVWLSVCNFPWEAWDVISKEKQKKLNRIVSSYFRKCFSIYICN